MQAYSNPERENDEHALPDLEIYQLTARECAEMEEDLIADYMRDPRFRLAGMNSRDRERMFGAMIEAEQISGGWFYQYCFPGCLPDGPPMGPYDTAEEACKAAQADAQD